MKKITVILFSCVFTLYLISCQKGAQGDVGPQGAAGAKGAAGVKGDVGSANANGMFASDWVEVKGTDWTATSSPNTFFRTLTWVPLTADIINKGVVYTYYKGTTEPNTVRALPFSNPSSGWKLYSIVGVSSNQPVIQFFQQVNPPLSTFNAATSYSFRIVVVAASSGRLAAIDWNNYQEVKAALNLVD